MRETEQKAGEGGNCRESIAKNMQIAKITKYIIEMNQSGRVVLTGLPRSARRILQAARVLSILDYSWLTEALHI